MGYYSYMYTLIESSTYSEWFARLRDRQAKARIIARLRRVELGNLGDWKPVGESVSELRIFYGSGYRVYFTQRGEEIILLLLGGDKSTQEDDIKKAIHLANELREQP